MNWGPDRWRLYGLALRETGRAMRDSLSWGFSTRLLGRALADAPALRPAGSAHRRSRPSRPTSIRASSPSPDASITTSGRSPFGFVPPSQAWGEALYGFGWLRHLRAAGTALAQANARSLVDEFVTFAPRRPAHRPRDRRSSRGG